MEKLPEGSEEPAEFTLPNRGAVTEKTWDDLHADGVHWFFNETDELTRWLQHADIVYGTENVLTGDPYDEDRERPRRELEGTGIYIRLAHEDQSRSA